MFDIIGMEHHIVLLIAFLVGGLVVAAWLLDAIQINSEAAHKRILRKPHS